MLLMLLMQLRSHLRQGPCRLLLLKLQLLLQRGALLTPARQSMQTAQEQAQGLVACKRIAPANNRPNFENPSRKIVYFSCCSLI